MLDQAERLRSLMRAESRPAAPGAARPQLVVVAGGKGGVGTTTLAVNLAVALNRGGHRTVLVDGDLGKADAASLCGTREVYHIADVLAGRRGLHEALQLGPAGVQVLPGAWATGHVTDCAPEAQDRLLRELARLESHADQVVLDAGNGEGRVVQRFCQAADRVLLVTSTDDASVMNAYAAIKLLRAVDAQPAIQLVVNLAHDAAEAKQIHDRLAHACRRFLGFELPLAGSLSHAAEVVEAGRRRHPFVLANPLATSSAQIEQLAAILSTHPGEIHELD
ncbi:MAG TPA: P-loop NTPase [Pirellulales bacterium]|nr:P-loop NTPase [Pirellulales bacterium]